MFGESANELVKKWGNGPYRYGFPDFYAAEFPVRPMHYDQSRIYAGVIGRHYPGAQTGRYHYMFDQNMYMQPRVPTGAGLGANVAEKLNVGALAVGGLVLAAGIAGVVTAAMRAGR